MDLRPARCRQCADGNRAMLKPSELTPATSAVITQIVQAVFTPEQVSVVMGDAETGAAFTALPFDHILFTGSTAVGKNCRGGRQKSYAGYT